MKSLDFLWRSAKRLGLGVSYLLVLWVCGCGPGLKEGAPVIRQFDFVGQDSQNGQIFFFLVKWQDGEGDLSATAEDNIKQGDSKALLSFKIEDLTEAQPTPLNVDFQLRSQGATFGNILVVDAQKTEGTFERLGLVLSAKDGKYPAKLRISLTLWDVKGNRSNTPTVTLETGS